MQTRTPASFTIKAEESYIYRTLKNCVWHAPGRRE